jgi:probable F420-dependent oxidoreductase
MQIGLHALGIGAGALPEVITAVASAAEAAGFGTLWAGEHVVMVDGARSRYPYADDGQLAVPADAPWLDPLVALTFAAAATQRVRLATGVLLLPEHNPVMLAKQIASLSVLCHGRLTLGIGVGWSREEFEALGVPFAGRGARADEYLAAMRALWRDDPASFSGEFTSFAAIRVNPKPLGGDVPVIVGGNSDAALSRVARSGQGWYGFNLTGIAQVQERVERLAQLCEAQGRNASDVHVAVALRDPQAASAEELSAAGVDELVLVANPPRDPAFAEEWARGLIRPWL